MPTADEPPAIAPTGQLATTQPESVLRFCERVRFTGSLAFQGHGARGVLPLLNGVPEIPAGDRGLERALDDFLALQQGTYALTQLLPPLEGASADGPLGVEGSLEKTTVADLLRYCEAAGLSGTLSLFRDDRACIARYLRGELLSMTVDEESDADLARLFAWDRGGFAIRANSVFEGQRTSVEPADRLLKTLELELAQILERSDRAAEESRPSSGSTAVRAPSMLRAATLPFGLEGGPGEDESESTPEGESVPAEGSVPNRPRSLPPPPQSPDSTVKVYFVDRAGAALPSSTQHSAGRLGAETIQLDAESQRLAVLHDADRVLAASREAKNGAATGAAPPGGREPEAAEPVPSHDVDRDHGREVARAPASTFSVPLTAAFGAILAASVITGLYTLVALVR